MNWHLLANLFAFGLFTQPAVWLALRFFRPARMRWWMVVLCSLLLGWVCATGASISSNKEMAAQIAAFEARDEPVPEELMREWSGDAPVVFAVMFGWAFAGVVFVIWLVPYGLAHAMRLAVGKVRVPADEEPPANGG